MFDVFDQAGNLLNEALTLDRAMEYAKNYGEFVVIKNGDMEIAGKFGVAAPPDDYEWSKDYSLGRRKSKKVWVRDDNDRDAGQDES